MDKKDFVWKLLIPCLIIVITIFIATFIQVFLFKSSSSFVVVIVKLTLGLFVSDITMALWIRPFILKTRKDDYTYNSLIADWISKHIHINMLHIILIGLAYCIISGNLVSCFGGEDSFPNVWEDRNLKLVFFATLIIAPIFETLFNQFAVIEIARSTLNKIIGYDYPVFIGMVSALVFSLMHNYSIPYVVCTFFWGLYFSFTYIYLHDHYHSKVIGFVGTMILHFLINSFPFLSMVLNQWT